MEDLKTIGFVGISDLSGLAETVKKGSTVGNAKEPLEELTSDTGAIWGSKAIRFFSGL